MAERLFLHLDGDAAHGPEASVPPGTLRAYAVRPALRGHVGQILHYRETVPEGQEVIERVLPDGAVRLVFNLGDAPTAEGEPAAPALAAVGASATPALVRLRRRVEGLSVALRPGAAAALLGVPAGEVAHAVVPLRALWGADADDLLQRLSEAREDGTRAAVLQDALQRRLVAARGLPPPAAVQGAGLIAAEAGRRPLREVAAALGIGERRLQQLFHAHVGLSPRAWGRLARLRACLRALRAIESPAWADLAVDCGYYDQAHLANEFRALCGFTPTEFLGRRLSGSSKTGGAPRG